MVTRYHISKGCGWQNGAIFIRFSFFFHKEFLLLARLSYD